MKGGYVHGATDELGMQAVDNRMHVHDLHATILHLMGLDHERLTYRYSGRDFRLTDVSGHVVARNPGVEKAVCAGSKGRRPCREIVNPFTAREQWDDRSDDLPGKFSHRVRSSTTRSEVTVSSWEIFTRLLESVSPFAISRTVHSPGHRWGIRYCMSSV